MKKIVGLAFILVLAFLIVVSVYNTTGVFKDNGAYNLSERVSESYINKSVTEENGEVVYGESKGLETGSANAVTDVITVYRSFDTLGEVTVLFLSALGVALLLSSGDKLITDGSSANFILKYGSKVILPLMMTIGVFIFTHGHLTPGGGFPGGTMIASAVLLLYMSDEKFRFNKSMFKTTESVAGSLYIVVGLVGLAVSGYFLSNFIDSGVVGDLISSGIVPIVYVLIGLKVGSELSGVVTDFMKEEA